MVGRIRGACERIIEEKLFNGVIKLHDSRIGVKEAPSLDAVQKSHWECVHAIWKACPGIIESQSNPSSGALRMPEPKTLKEWHSELEQVVDEVTSARNPAKAAAPTPPPAAHAGTV